MKRKLVLLLPVLALVLGLLPLVVSAGGPWEDNFDSYANGTILDNVGGWRGWGGVPAAAGIVDNAQSNSSPNSVRIEFGMDAIHEFTETDGQWVFGGELYIPANLSGQTYFIMLNTYDDSCATCNWSVQVSFNSATGLILDEGLTNSTMPYITGQWVPFRVEIDLDADTQDFYYNNALLYTSNWSGHVSGGGATSIAVVDLYANGATPVYYDDLYLQPPFVAEPAIDLEKSPDYQVVTNNGIADFTITVTNTGNVTLTDVTVADVLVPACDMAVGEMGPGEVTSYTCSDLGNTESYTNTAVVTSLYNGVTGPADTDTAFVEVSSPTSVSLSAFGADSGIDGRLIGLGALLVVAAGLGLALRRKAAAQQ